VPGKRVEQLLEQEGILEQRDTVSSMPPTFLDSIDPNRKRQPASASQRCSWFVLESD
jgi:hypothetical protein